ncbi:MAG: spermidine synthase [Candidatus Kaiserbacteria bacterium]|nr:spermidine synthase [Candidatus Kaiserbacteria bacterium]
MPAFTPRSAWPEYNVKNNIPSWMNPENIGTNPRGTRYGFWPFYVEIYAGSTPPDLDISNTEGKPHNRVIMWRMFDTSRPLPKGWFILKPDPDYKGGYALIEDSVPYYKAWSRRSQEYRTKWLRSHLGKTHIIEPINYEQFKHSYMQSHVGKHVGAFLLEEVRKRLEAATTPVYLWGIRDVSTNIYVAGMAVEYSESCKSTYYLNGFYATESSKVPLMVGMFDYWFMHSQARGCRYIDFGVFWKKGDPASWKGFSEFKSKFGTHYFISSPIAYHFAAVGVIKRIEDFVQYLYMNNPLNKDYHSPERAIASSVHSTIYVDRVGSDVRVRTGDVYQTSQYINTMWKKALKHIKKYGRIPRTQAKVLMLGLGTGGAVIEFYKQLPECTITAIEIDPAMIALTRTMQMFKPYKEPTIIEGDAAEIMAKLQETYDLIVVDIFTDTGASPLLNKEDFVISLKKNLNDSGMILVNVYRDTASLSLFQKMYTTLSIWKYKHNTLGLFSI